MEVYNYFFLLHRNKMDLKFSEADVTFREEVVNFLETEYPDDIKEKQDKRIPLEKDEIVRWQQILNKKGWFAIKYHFRSRSGFKGQPLASYSKWPLQTIWNKIQKL